MACEEVPGAAAASKPGLLEVVGIGQPPSCSLQIQPEPRDGPERTLKCKRGSSPTPQCNVCLWLRDESPTPRRHVCLSHSASL